MERGNSKGASSSKASGSESKNKQDAPNKYFPRSPRFKDNFSPRSDTRHKSYPNRAREHVDKKPRNRGGAVCEKYWSQIEDGAVGESLSGQKTQCKKANLNHLLKFTLAPAVHWEGNTGRPSHNRSKAPKYNKELFLQANYQFVVKDDGNYKIHESNSDILVDWSLIEEIVVPCHEVPLCPICLYVPVAAKITRCGHVYCWPCMLHYLALTDKSWQKCPICFDAVHKDDLKSVSLQGQKSFVIGDKITMFLMKREKGSLLPVPVTQDKTPQTICKIDDENIVTRYQKLLLASRKEVQFIINREKVELQNAYEKEKDTPEACFIESALKLLEGRDQCVNPDLNPESANQNEKTVLEVNPTTRKHLISVSSSDSFDDNVTTDIKNDNILKPKKDTIPNVAAELSETKGISYFYQAEDGQHIYLQNINVRMFLKDFGSLEFAPQTITAKIVDIERVSMTEALRKRLRYLLHLPLTCEFQIAELDFRHIASDHTMQQFENELKKRKIQRNKKARDERRREKMIEVEENKKLGKYPKATYNLNSADQFPVYNPEDFLSLSPPKHDSYAAVSNSSESLHSNVNTLDNCVDDTVDNEVKCETTTSFAQMLKVGPKSFARARENKAAPLTCQPAVDSEVEDFTSAPDYRTSFSDAIQAALDAVTLKEPTGTNQGSRKKKKGKQQLLFTTAMCRNK